MLEGLMMYQPLTIGALIDHAARHHGDTEIVSVETDGTRSRSDWAGIAANARRLASALEGHGIGPGDRVATIAWNNRRHLECYFGVSGGGRVLHTVNPRLFPEQMAYVLNHAGDRVLFFDRTFLPVVQALRPKLETVEHYVLLGGRDEEARAGMPDLQFYDELLEEGTADHPWPEIDERAASSLCYTSGTTGNPKGVLYSHRSTLIHALASALPDTLGISARETVLPVVPLFHVNAWGTPYAAALTGARLVLPGPFLDGESLVKLIDEEGVSLALGVPTIWQGLLIAAEKTGSRLESLKRTVIGGSACPPAMIEAFRERHDVEVLHAWGMTELSPLGTVNTLKARHLSLPEEEQHALRLSQGRPPFGIEMRIVDDAGRPLPHDGTTQGELQVRGHWVLSEYFGAEPGTTLTEDGWFATGDVATIDADGYLEIRDRAKDVIKSGGEWISSVELENIAMGHPDVLEAAAIAARHPKWDERPVLLVVPKEGVTLDADEIRGMFEGRVARWQIPDRVIVLDEPLPRNATGKVLKRHLRERFGDVLIANDAG